MGERKAVRGQTQREKAAGEGFCLTFPALKMEERGLEPRNVGSLPKQQKSREQTLLEPRVGHTGLPKASL